MQKIVHIIFIGAFMAACSSSTEITGSWNNPEATDKNYNTIIVTALTSNTKARQTVEDDLAAALGRKGIKASKSLEVFPPSFTNGEEVDKEALLDKIHDTQVEAILTVALIDEETEQRYVPGSYGYAPMTRFGFYGRFWGYYTNWYPTLYSPGYYVDDKVYFIETNLYDADTERLIWSAQSETYNPASLDKFSEEFSAAVINSMSKDGVIN